MNDSKSRLLKGLKSTLGPVSLLHGNAPQPEGLLMENGILKLLPAMDYDHFDPDGLRLWCHHHARYGLPTLELVAFLRELIGKRNAIEIGSGCGDLCFHLGITGTDNYMQTFPDIAAHYDLLNQPRIQYGQHVVRLDAMQAIDTYQPDIVIASWVTQYVDPLLPLPPAGGNMYGVREDEILRRGITYVLIGNESVHGEKNIMKLPHDQLHVPFLRSRSIRPHFNRIWIWNR